MSWQDFGDDTALERTLLEQALPLVATESTGAWRATVDLTHPERVSMAAQVGVADSFGPTPEGCVELLQIRPLLFGTAWKVLALLVEQALLAAGETAPSRNGRWTIAQKVEHARAAAGRPTALDVTSWRALATVYVETFELRHCLVHRAVFVDPLTRSLAGHDAHGVALRAATPEEQEAFARAVLRAAQLVLAPAPDERVTVDLRRHLGVHGVALPPVPPYEVLREITAIVGPDPAASGWYVLNVSALRARVGLAAGAPADLIVQLEDRPGQELRGRLEHAPDAVVQLDPAAPPAWLS